MHIHAVRGRPKAVCGEKAPVPSTTLATLQGGQGRQSPLRLRRLTECRSHFARAQWLNLMEALPPHVAAGPRRRHSPLAATDEAHSGGDTAIGADPGPARDLRKGLVQGSTVELTNVLLQNW